MGTRDDSPAIWREAETLDHIGVSPERSYNHVPCHDIPYQNGLVTRTRSDSSAIGRESETGKSCRVLASLQSNISSLSVPDNESAVIRTRGDVFTVWRECSTINSDSMPLQCQIVRGARGARQTVLDRRFWLGNQLGNRVRRNGV